MLFFHVHFCIYIVQSLTLYDISYHLFQRDCRSAISTVDKENLVFAKKMKEEKAASAALDNENSSTNFDLLTGSIPHGKTGKFWFTFSIFVTFATFRTALRNIFGTGNYYLVTKNTTKTNFTKFYSGYK